MRALLALSLLAAPPAFAQSATGPTGRLPPNAADRAVAASDQRSAAAATSIELDRLRAEQAQRDAAASTRGSVVGSTMTDGVAGQGSRPTDADPVPR